MKIQLLDLNKLSEDRIKLIAENECQKILKNKICPVCKNGFTDINDAVCADKTENDLIIAHLSCYTNRYN